MFGKERRRNELKQVVIQEYPPLIKRGPILDRVSDIEVKNRYFCGDLPRMSPQELTAKLTSLAEAGSLDSQDQESLEIIRYQMATITSELTCRR